MVNQWTILLLATVQLGHTSDNFAEKKLCTDHNLTLSLSQIPQLRRAVVTSDPIPIRARTTCALRVIVDTAAAINITLTTVNIWKSSTNSSGSQGYQFQHKSGNTKFVYKNDLEAGSIAWSNASIEPCPYLFVWRASATNYIDAAKSIFNESTTLNATGIIIELRDVPESVWCAIRIDISASPMPEHYCRAKDELYCNTSVQCLNASLRCNRNPDCDNGEDEMDCSTDGITKGTFTVEIAVSLSVALGVVLLMMAAIVIVLWRRWLKRLRCKDDSYGYSNNHRGETSLPESSMLPCLIDNVVYSPSPDGPESLKVNTAEPIYFVLEAQCDEPSTSSVKSTE